MRAAMLSAQQHGMLQTYEPILPPGPVLLYSPLYYPPRQPAAGVQPYPTHNLPVGMSVLEEKSEERALADFHEQLVCDWLLDNGIFAINVAKINGSADLAVWCTATHTFKAVNVKLAAFQTTRGNHNGNHNVQNLNDLPDDTLVIALVRESAHVQGPRPLISCRAWVG